MFVRIKNYLINIKEVVTINKKSTAGGATIAIRLKYADQIEIYFYDKEEERDAAFEFLATTLLKEEA